MSVQIQKMLVPRIAVERTVRRMCDFYAKFHGQVTPEIYEKIKSEAVRQANIMNATGGITPNEAGNSPILNGGRKVHASLDDE